MSNSIEEINLAKDRIEELEKKNEQTNLERLDWKRWLQESEQQVKGLRKALDEKIKANREFIVIAIVALNKYGKHLENPRCLRSIDYPLKCTCELYTILAPSTPVGKEVEWLKVLWDITCETTEDKPVEERFTAIRQLVTNAVFEGRPHQPETQTVVCPCRIAKGNLCGNCYPTIGHSQGCIIVGCKGSGTLTLEETE